MSRGLPILLAVVLATGCKGETRTPPKVPPPTTAEPIQDQDLLMRVSAPVTEVEFGVSFPLTVVRVWSKELVPEEWSDEILAPLTVRLVDSARREDDLRIEETRHYDCRAFRSGEVTVPSPWFRAKPKDGGIERLAFADDLRFRVASSLTLGEAGDVELPGEPFPAPFRWLLWSGIGAAALAGLALFFWNAHRKTPCQAATPRTTPHERALERLKQLRDRPPPQGRDELRADSVAASSIVRTYIEERFSVHAPEMTTEEFLEDAHTSQGLLAAHRETLAEFLAHCDLVKFACHAPAVGERERLLDAVEAFVLATALDETTTRAENET